MVDELSIRESVHEEMERRRRFLEAEGEEHFYGPWKGGPRGSGGRPMTKAELAAARDAKTKIGATVGPQEAVDALARGERPHITASDVAPTMDILAKRDDILDLTELQVDGTLKFGGDGMGLARAEMPQLGSAVLPQYLDELRGRGVKVETVRVRPEQMKPTQKEVNASKSAQFALGYRDGSLKKGPIVVSSDNYVIDGHHRWGGATAHAFSVPGMTIDAIRIDMKADPLLTDALKWTSAHGVARKKLGESAVWDGLHDIREEDDDHFYGPWKGGSRKEGGHPAGEESLGRYTDDKGKWDAERVAKVHEAYYASVLDGVAKTDEPTVYMTGGGPASGKSNFVESDVAGFPRGKEAGVAHVDPDQAKAAIPEYKAGISAGYQGAAGYVHEESSTMSKVVVARALAGSHNVVYDTVGDNGIDKLEAKVAQMRAQGAKKINGSYAIVNVNEAIRRADARGAATGRYVAHAEIRRAHAGVRSTLTGAIERGVFDDLKVFDTNGKSPRLVASYTKTGGLNVVDQAAWSSYTSGGYGA